MKDETLWAIAFGMMFAALIGCCIPALEYLFGGWVWLALLLLAIFAAVLAVAITSEQKERKQ